MKQLIHSNGSNESNERKLTFSCIAVELCKECTNHHETAKNTNGQNKQFEKSAQPHTFLLERGGKQGSDAQITVTFLKSLSRFLKSHVSIIIGILFLDILSSSLLSSLATLSVVRLRP